MDAPSRLTRLSPRTEEEADLEAGEATTEATTEEVRAGSNDL